MTNTVSPSGTNSCGGFLPCCLSNGVPVATFFHTWKGCFLRVSPTTVGLSSHPGYSCVLLAKWQLIVLMMPRSGIAVFSMFDGLVPFHCILCGDFYFSHFSYTFSERNDCRFCVALQGDLTITKQVHEFRHSLNCPRFFNSLFQRNAAHGVLMSVFH